MLRWTLNLAYLVLLVAVSPVIAWRMMRGKYRTGWGQKLLGRLPERTHDGERIWIHAVSVGEVLQLRSVVAGLRERRPDADLLISTTTSTGFEVAVRTFPDVTVCYCPLDFSWAVDRAIARVRPTSLILVERELWPNLLLGAERAGVPVGLVNGRLGEKSLRGYRWITPLMRRMLDVVEVVAVQHEIVVDRFRALGADPDRLRVTGSLKFDQLETDRANQRTTELREAFALGDDDLVLVAGSTQVEEEELVLEAYEELRADLPDLRLVVVPRHAERFDEVAERIVDRGHGLVRRTDPTSVLEAEESVRLLDTLGELGACWGLADVAYVGGSLESHRGGQNMMEPAGYGAAVTFGPNTWNFAEVVAELRAADAARVVTDGDSMTTAFRELLTDRTAARTMGERARAIVLANRGATERTLDAIVALLDRKRPTGLRRAA